MTGLRWLLAIGVVLAGIGFGAFVLLANNFRRSFGASENNLLIAVIPLILSLAVAWWLVRKPALLPPQSLAYPVLLVEQDKIIEVCLNVEELTLRPENQDHHIEQRLHIVDATGARFRIENYRVTQPKPSSLSRVVNATVFNVLRFRVAFDLRADGVLSREEVMAQLRDRDWTLPAAVATAPMGELFVAYRADRYREFGNARDAMPDGPALPAKSP